MTDEPDPDKTERVITFRPGLDLAYELWRAGLIVVFEGAVLAAEGDADV